MVIANGDNVGIGTTAPGRKLFVNGDAGGTGAWNNDSDERLKKNIITIPNVLEKVLQLRGVQFEWKDTTNHPLGAQIGFLAQESLDIIPEVITKQNEYYGMQYAPITAILTEAVKEQQEMIEELMVKNEELRARIELLEQK